MKSNDFLRTNLLLKIGDVKPNMILRDAKRIVDRLFECDEILMPNILEWAENKPISDIWVRDKYCVNAVMKMRGCNDFISAVIALDDYLKDESTEFALWQMRV